MSTLTDPIADFLTRIRNASRSHRSDVTVPYSRMKEQIARILKQEGYITDFEVDKTVTPALLKLTMKFVNRTPALTGVKRVSRRPCAYSRPVVRQIGALAPSSAAARRG